MSISPTDLMWVITLKRNNRTSSRMFENLMDQLIVEQTGVGQQTHFLDYFTLPSPFILAFLLCSHPISQPLRSSFIPNTIVDHHISSTSSQLRKYPKWQNLYYLANHELSRVIATNLSSFHSRELNVIFKNKLFS